MLKSEVLHVKGVHLTIQRCMCQTGLCVKEGKVPRGCQRWRCVKEGYVSRGCQREGCVKRVSKRAKCQEGAKEGYVSRGYQRVSMGVLVVNFNKIRTS